MASNIPRAGVAGIRVPSSNGIALPSLATLSFTASGDTLDDSLFNGLTANLATGVNFQVAVALVGQDNTKGGWSVTPSTPSSGTLQLTGTQNYIKVTIPNANWPNANFKYAGFVAVFLATGQGDFQLAWCQPVDAQRDMVLLVCIQPLSAVESFPIATLTSTTTVASNALGDRKPTGYAFTTIQPTTQDVELLDTVGGSVTFSPNTAQDYNVATARGFDVRFQTLINDVKTIITAGAGVFAAKTIGGVLFQQSARAVNTSQIIVKGNAPLLIDMPNDPSLGVGETLLATSMLLQNQDQIAMAWSKGKQTSVPFHYQQSPTDSLFTNVPTVWTSLRK